MAVAPIIHIGGWPGAGKRTVGLALAERLNARLIDNHLMLDAARALYARNTPGSIDVREEVRAVLMRHARLLPPQVPIVLTDALADEPQAAPLFQPTRDLARERGAPLICVVLTLTEAENERRLTCPNRTGLAKLRDAEVLRQIRQHDTLYMPEGAQVLDVTSLSAEAAADQIWALIKAQVETVAYG